MVHWEATQLLSLSASDFRSGYCDLFPTFSEGMLSQFSLFLDGQVFSFSLLEFHTASHFFDDFFFVHYFPYQTWLEELLSKFDKD